MLLATPLITKADGTKFGKSEGDSVWLDPEMTSPYAFYQYWLNVEDASRRQPAADLHLPLARGDRGSGACRAERPAAREAQRALADDVTTLVHGSAARDAAVAASRALFGQGDLADLDPATLESALRAAPFVELPAGATPSVVDLLVDTGLVASRAAARRAVEEGGAYLNNARVADVDAVVDGDEWLFGRYAVLRRGKRTVGGAIRAS